MRKMSDVDQVYEYAAFVSYRRIPADRRWAEWLIEALETFETPPALVQRGVSPKIGRLFRDDDEMATSADVGQHIRSMLWASEYLIVVCSPETPQSDWVRAEIQLFKHWGREDKILTLLTEDPPRTVIPPELRHWKMTGLGRDVVMEMQEPAAASVAPQQGRTEEELKSLARDQLASRLLGCPFNELRDCQLERERRKTSVAYFEAQVRRGVRPRALVRSRKMPWPIDTEACALRAVAA